MTTATTPLAGSYTADPVHSSFGFSVRYQGVSIFRGTLDEVAATYEDGKLHGAAKAESISIRTPDAFRQHVLGAEFFDAANHPDVVFTSTSADLREDGTAVVEGELTIKGITKPVTATGTYQAPVQDPYGGVRSALELTATLDRREWEMNWQAPLPSGEDVLAWDVTLSVNLELVQQEG